MTTFTYLLVFTVLVLTLSILSIQDVDAANANLFVSAENSQFSNYMSGPQVIEVVIIDSDINETDEAKGEPDVTINGRILRMVQGADGNWYGYFADRNMAQIADSTATGNTPGEGLDFGYFCDNTVTIGDPNTSATVGFSDTVGVAIDEVVGGAADGSPTGGPITSVCGTNIAGSSTDDSNIVRNAKLPSLTASASLPTGQIGIDENLWPVIQLYSLNPTGNVVIQYNKGGGVQSTTLTFDTVDQFASLTLDQSSYPQGSQVLVTVTDSWLNIDPTDEDSWTFGANTNNAPSFGTYYQVFDDKGDLAGASVPLGTINIADKLPALMCEGNCVLIVNPNKQNSANPVLTLQDNDDSAISLTGLGGVNDALSFSADGFGSELLGTGSIPVTITEQGRNSGVFHTYDESNNSVFRITNNAERGTSATIDYNETPITVLVFTDTDSDGIPDSADNCIDISNPLQEDADLDGIGNVCDGDDDNDGIFDGQDSCPFTPETINYYQDTDGCPDTAPATITIITDTVPNSPLNFGFTATGLTPANFSLDDDSDPALSNTRTFSNVPPSTYTITEGGAAGFRLTSILCSDPDNGTTVNLTTRRAIIDLDSGENVTCTFTNIQTGAITILEDTNPNGPQNFAYTAPTLVPPNFLLDDDFDAALPNFRYFGNVLPGNHTMIENIVTGFKLTNLSCIDPDNGTLINLASRVATIDLDYGESITCTFTNTRTGTITILEDTVPNGPQNFVYSSTGGLVPINFALDDDTDVTLSNFRVFNNVPIGIYTITQNIPAGFTLTGLSCVDPDNGSAVNLATRVSTIDLDAGESITCTYTNTAN